MTEINKINEGQQSHTAAYELAHAGEIDTSSFWASMAQHGIPFGHQVLMLPFGEHNQIGNERRQLYFQQAFSEGTVPTTRIISYGECNVACPYCKRDMQFIDENGIPQESVAVRLDDVARLITGAVERGETVRFSGGDPVVYPKETLALSQWAYETYGIKSSIAHNGSGPVFVERILPYLSSAAIDLKAVPEKIATVMGIPEQLGQRRYGLSLETQRMISHGGVLLDVRTPLFGDTNLEEMDRLAADIVRVNEVKNTFWTWRLYKEVKGCNWPLPDKNIVIKMMKDVSGRYPSLWMGMRAKWEKGGMLFVKNGEIQAK